MEDARARRLEQELTDLVVLPPGLVPRPRRPQCEAGRPPPPLGPAHVWLVPCKARSLHLVPELSVRTVNEQ